jgi:hypothetical protein
MKKFGLDAVIVLVTSRIDANSHGIISTIMQAMSHKTLVVYVNIKTDPLYL